MRNSSLGRRKLRGRFARAYHKQQYHHCLQSVGSEKDASVGLISDLNRHFNDEGGEIRSHFCVDVFDFITILYVNMHIKTSASYIMYVALIAY